VPSTRPTPQFSLDKSSFEATPQQLALMGGRAVVEFTPCTGTVPARGSMALEVLFSPSLEQSYNYNVLCKVGGWVGVPTWSGSCSRAASAPF